MKKTLTVNLAGMVFHIDSDAYNQLQDYLEKVEQNMSDTDDKKDILQDIEARIAELFTLRLQKAGVQVVNEEMVAQMIEQLGTPDMFSSEDAGEKSAHQRKKARRLYRDGKDKLLGGVCAGLGEYYAIDPVWLRLLFVLFAFFYTSSIWVYLVLWIILPVATTAAQRLEMRGEDTSVGNIEREVIRTKQESETAQGSHVIRTIVSVCLKIFMGIMMIIFVPVCLFILGLTLLVLVACVGSMIEFFTVSSGVPMLFNMIDVSNHLGLVILLVFFSLILIIIPIVKLIILIMQRIRKKKILTDRMGWAMFAIWVCSLIGFGATSLYAATLIAENPYEVVTSLTSDGNDVSTAPIEVIDNLSYFHAVRVEGCADVVLQQGAEQSVTMQTHNPENFSFVVRNGELLIRQRNHTKQCGANFVITAPRFTSIETTGASRVRTESVLAEDKLELEFYGATEADIAVRTRKLDLETSGASKILLHGETQQFDVEVNGSGRVDAKDLLAQDADVDCNGASRLTVNVSNYLEAEANGASQIYYYGNPRSIRRESNGVSKIKKM